MNSWANSYHRKSIRRDSTAMGTRSKESRTRRHASRCTQQDIPNFEPQIVPVGSSTTSESSNERRCRVPGCPIIHCQLNSHSGYRPRQAHLNNRLEHIKPGDCTSAAAIALEHQEFRTYLTRLVVRSLDARPTLPLDGLEAPRAQHLFNEFFSTRLDQILRLTDPPPVSTSQKMVVAGFKNDYFTAALKHPLICTQTIAAAYFPLALREGCRELDHTALILQSKLMALLRSQLSQDVKDVNPPDLAMTVYIIAMLEIAFGRIDVLAVHRDAMKGIVSSAGGLQNMGYATRHIRVFDRMISNFSSVPLCFPSLPYKHSPRPIHHQHVYGNNLSQVIMTEDDASVVGYCLDTCRLIEILEGTNYSFKFSTSTKPVNTGLHELYDLRESNMNQFINLNVQTAHDRTISRCMLMCAAIVAYSTLHDNYVAMLPQRWASIVRSIITDPNFIMTPNNRNIVIWILFVLSTVEVSWPARFWAFAELRTLLTVKYGRNTWPVGWKDTELENLRDFVWSDVYLKQSFDLVCQELDSQPLVVSSNLHAIFDASKGLNHTTSPQTV